MDNLSKDTVHVFCVNNHYTFDPPVEAECSKASGDATTFDRHSFAGGRCIQHIGAVTWFIGTPASGDDTNTEFIFKLIWHEIGN